VTTLSSDQLKVVRSWVGTEPTDDDLNERYNRLADVDLVIRETLDSQMSELLEQPDRITTPDGTTIAITTNLQILQQRIKDFRNRGSGYNGKTPNVTSLHRPDYR